MKIKYFPFQPHCFAFGGFELQMLSAFDAIQKKGVKVEKMDIWSRDNNFDILHCWGAEISNYYNFYWANKTNKKLVVTSLSSYYETNIERLRFMVSLLFYRQRFVKEMYGRADKIVVVNESQADVIHRFYGINCSKIAVIPNIVGNSFFKQNPEPIIEQTFQFKDYFLCVGNICQRKNQINLVKAVLKAGVKLLMIGKNLDGEEAYWNELKDLIAGNKNILLIEGLKENSELLVAAFNECKAFILPSYAEQQPISVLEAIAFEKPVILADRAYAKQNYFTGSLLVNPDSVASISAMLIKADMDNAAYKTNKQNILACSESEVGASYIQVYRDLL